LGSIGSFESPTTEHEEESHMQEFSYGDQSFQAYLATPTASSGAGILIFHSWWGLTNIFKCVCDRLAADGFVALAPDLFHGATAQTIDEAKHVRSQVDRSSVKKEVRAAIDYLKTHSAVSGEHLGAIGFSYGCSYAMESARLRPKIVKAVTLFYGTGGGKLDKTQSVFQGHFAENDEWGANPKKAEKLAQRIRDANQEAVFYVYPDTTHWFFEEGNAAYDEDAAQLAWQRTVAFMTEQLT
jgi:carboxymethylenebutenolidase